MRVSCPTGAQCAKYQVYGRQAQTASTPTPCSCRRLEDHHSRLCAVPRSRPGTGRPRRPGPFPRRTRSGARRAHAGRPVEPDPQPKRSTGPEPGGRVPPGETSRAACRGLAPGDAQPTHVRGQNSLDAGPRVVLVVAFSSCAPSF
ncbi:DUF6480 family protein [Streptomyces cellostaticus]|uniref:DUF6480 family protein n=1 Tax=Streptomyces cellostaticus TaxID=67285 RepID=UPI001FC9AED0|nr:DUF6480 family protein [Streptomyces cellostaticus]